MPAAIDLMTANAGDPASTAHHHRTIERAAKTASILEPFGGEFDTYTSGETTLTAYCKWKAKMDASSLKWAFKLAEANVAPFYRSCVGGWQPKKKQSDLNKNWARYIVLSDKATKRPVAYAMFRFDMDYGCSVLYWYVSFNAQIF